MPVISGGRIVGDSPEYSFADAGGDSPKGLSIYQEVLTAAGTGGTGAFRQGALNVQINRAAAQADTAWDGNADCGIKLIATNRATGNVAAQGAVRGLDVQGRNRGTNINWVNSAQFNARNDSAMTASSLWGIMIRVENYGTVNDDIVGLDVNLSDENDTGSHTKHGILIRNTDQSAQAAADAAIKVSHTSTNGFTAFAELASTGDGWAASSSAVSSAATNALVVKINGTLRYIPCYAAATF
jgi:hypothetical protein